MKIIEVSGLDGAGKTTAIEFIYSKLVDKGFKVKKFVELGDSSSPALLALRNTVLNANSCLDPRTDELIKVAMCFTNQKLYKQYKDELFDFVIVDRGYLDHQAYAYAEFGPDSSFYKDLYKNFFANQAFVPDYVLYLDIDPKLAYERVIMRGNSLDKIEQRGVAFFSKVRDGFDEAINQKRNTIHANPSETILINANNGSMMVKNDLELILNSRILSSR